MVATLVTITDWSFNYNSSLTVQVFDNEVNDLHVRLIITISWDNIT